MQRALLSKALEPTICAAITILMGCIGCGGSGGNGGSGSGSSATYTLGGTLAGLGSGQSVALQDNGGDTLTLNANGAFTFPVGLDSGAPYAVTVQSHTPGIACTVANGSGTVGSSDVTGIALSCAAGAESVLSSFGASTTDALHPYAGLVMDKSGNLYGTTPLGGTYGDGTVFKISPGPSGTYTETILYSFGASANDGQNPIASLIIDSFGNLYGTTVGGGGVNYGGTAFELSPSGAGAYTETILHTFVNYIDGAGPKGGLVFDNAGNLYGTTIGGGTAQWHLYGTVFRLSPSPSGVWTETILYSFGTNPGDGIEPESGVIMDSSGNLYGTTYGGGTGGVGAVYRLSPGAAGIYAYTTLYSFTITEDGEYPFAGLIMDSSGNLYGSTSIGGAGTFGIVFKLSPSPSGAYTETILHSFGGGAADGKDPSGLVMDSAGNLYGTAAEGGANGSSGGGSSGYGTVFKLSPGSAGAYTYSTLYSFGGTATDGQSPLAGLFIDSAGNLYGTTENGGTNGDTTNYLFGGYGYGTIFEIN